MTDSPSPWRPPPALPGLGADDVDLWLFHLGEWPDALLAEHLAPDERERAERYRHAGARQEFLRTRGLLRRTLSAYLGRPPESLRFAYGPQGKPALDGDGGWLNFNASHSHGLALLAVTRRPAVGVDVERLDPGRSLDGLAERYFSPAEVAEFRRLPEADRGLAFYRIWTRKEAFIKAISLGLTFGLDRFDVTMGPDARLLAVRGGATDAAAWTLTEVAAVGPAHVAAVAVAGPAVTLHPWLAPPPGAGG